MLVAWLLGCGVEEAVSVDDVTNTWWHLEDNDLNVYLEQHGDGDEGSLWYDFVVPDEALEDNVYGGEWVRLAQTRFLLDYFGKELKVTASPSDVPDCYNLHLGLLANDLACPL
ncbi:MAG: hypothetical protein R3F59_34685 [Myxococcota bacterium]